MILHQAERTASHDVHAPGATDVHAPSHPQTYAGTAATVASGAAFGQNARGATAADSRFGFASIMEDERSRLWQSARPQPLEERGARPAGRWPAPATDSPRLGRQVLRADPCSPKLARDFTRTTLAEWRLGHLADEATLVVSELVTNALCHGLSGTALSAQQCPVQLVLLGHRRRLVTVVTDPAERIPALSERGSDAESGRGLQVVEAVSAAWGWAPLATGGKAVWAAFDVIRQAADRHRPGR